MKKLLDDNQPLHCRVACRDRAAVEFDFHIFETAPKGGEQRERTILSTCVRKNLNTLLRVYIITTRSPWRKLIATERYVCVSGMFLTRFRRGLTGKHIYMIAFLIPQAV